MAKMNPDRGPVSPFSGDFNNPYQHSCGAFIRAKIWACIAPGAQDPAVRFAYNDACIDHAHSEGTIAALFVAVLERAAFVVSYIDRLLDLTLVAIPRVSGVARAVTSVRRAYRTA